MISYPLVPEMGFVHASTLLKMQKCRVLLVLCVVGSALDLSVSLFLSLLIATGKSGGFNWKTLVDIGEKCWGYDHLSPSPSAVPLWKSGFGRGESRIMAGQGGSGWKAQRVGKPLSHSHLIALYSTWIHERSLSYSSRQCLTLPSCPPLPSLQYQTLLMRGYTLRFSCSLDFLFRVSGFFSFSSFVGYVSVNQSNMALAAGHIKLPIRHCGRDPGHNRSQFDQSQAVEGRRQVVEWKLAISPFFFHS